MREGSLGKTVVVQAVKEKYHEQEGESDQDAYVYCTIYINTFTVLLWQCFDAKNQNGNDLVKAMRSVMQTTL